MPPVVTAAFSNWLKNNPNIKLLLDNAVTRILYEGITSYDLVLTDFDHKSIQALPAICKETINAIAADPGNGIAAEPVVNGANISSISVRWLCVAVDAAKYYTAIRRAMTAQNMHYTNVLAGFKVEHDAYVQLKDEDEPKVPKINDRDSERKVICWIPIFEDYLFRCFGAHGPLQYVVREDPDVPAEALDPLEHGSYHGTSGSLMNELVARLPQNGPIFQNDNTSVFMKIEEAVRGTSVESTVKTFSWRKDGRSAFLALRANHAGDTKYRTISKKRLNFLQNVKWTGRTYPLETHVTNHRSAFDDLRDCAQHITVPVPDDAQRVEYLIDSIHCSDSTLQAAIGLVCADTNNMHSDFELASASLIEVNPYCRSSKAGQTTNCQGEISAIDFHAGQGDTGVDLRWHHLKEFTKLPNEQKDKLCAWLKTAEGKKSKAASKKAAGIKRKAPNPNANDNAKQGSWKKKLTKQKMKMNKGLATVMSVLKEQEASNKAFVSALRASTTAAPPSAPTAAPVPAAADQPTNSISG